MLRRKRGLQMKSKRDGNGDGDGKSHGKRSKQHESNDPQKTDTHSICMNFSQTIRRSSLL